MTRELFPIRVVGNVAVYDVTVGRRLVFRDHNDIHPENCAYAIAQALSGSTGGVIKSMALGSGGTHLDAAGNLVYLPPNVTAESANLYQQTYIAKINSNIADGEATPTGNSVISTKSPAPEITSEITCTLFLPANEPAGQASNDAATTDPNAPYIFDELGLKNADGRLLTHIVFSPIEKTANRIFEIKYSLVVSVA